MNKVKTTKHTINISHGANPSIHGWYVVVTNNGHVFQAYFNDEGWWVINTHNPFNDNMKDKPLNTVLSRLENNIKGWTDKI